MKAFVVFPLLFCIVRSAPSERIFTKQAPADLLTLPSNATSIRADISDSFSCDGREYGYYADVDNDCQLFHVCLPITLTPGRTQTFRWSFICPGDTVFNQEMFTCTRYDDSIECADSPKYYELNKSFGIPEKEDPPVVEETQQEIEESRKVLE